MIEVSPPLPPPPVNRVLGVGCFSYAGFVGDRTEPVRRRIVSDRVHINGKGWHRFIVMIGKNRVRCSDTSDEEGPVRCGPVSKQVQCGQSCVNSGATCSCLKKRSVFVRGFPRFVVSNTFTYNFGAARTPSVRGRSWN